MIDLLYGLWTHIESYRKKQLFLLILLVFVSGVFEVFSLGAIIPFIGFLIDPTTFFSSDLGNKFSNFINYKQSQNLLFLITLIFILMSFMAGLLRLLVLWYSTKIAFASGAEISLKVYKKTLYQPYHVHINRQTSEVITNVTNRVNAVVFAVLFPLVSLVSSFIMIVFILSALFYINPLIASVTLMSFGAVYLLIAMSYREKLLLNSLCISEEQVVVLKNLQEGLGGIRDILINGTQKYYCQLYKKSDETLRNAQGSNIFIAGSPRFLMESLGVILIAVIAYFFTVHGGTGKAILPILGSLAFAAQRILPSLQQAYGAVTTILGTEATLKETINTLEMPTTEIQQNSSLGVKFDKEIVFKNVSFQYAESLPLVLNRINFNIPKGSKVGIVGKTGGGKSTLIDVLMGLLEPTSGELLIDGLSLNGRSIISWQKMISHVPQEIFLSDATIFENIAIGVPREDIDCDRVIASAKIAHAASFIEKKPGKYETIIGERGIKLSGGEKQRIGIARALYRSQSVLIFDEATSALDTRTEELVMDSIYNSNPKLTIFMIAHRLNTLKKCDVILEVSKNGIATYKDIEEYKTRRLSVKLKNLVRQS